MGLFSLTEQKALNFHQALLGLLRSHPNLRTRALAELERMRDASPAQVALYDQWAALLEKSLEDMAEVILADSADAGLLRAHSPFIDALDPSERNAIWQRIGLVQFMGHYADAADDLALDLSEQAAITGIAIEELTHWRSHAPQEIGKHTLHQLKLVVGLHKTLLELAPDRAVRRRWLRVESETLGAAPLTMLSNGKAADVLENLAGSTQLTLGPDNMPRMGN